MQWSSYRYHAQAPVLESCTHYYLLWGKWPLNFGRKAPGNTFMSSFLHIYIIDCQCIGTNWTQRGLHCSIIISPYIQQTTILCHTIMVPFLIADNYGFLPTWWSDTNPKLLIARRLILQKLIMHVILGRKFGWYEYMVILVTPVYTAYRGYPPKNLLYENYWPTGTIEVWIILLWIDLTCLPSVASSGGVLY